MERLCTEHCRDTTRKTYYNIWRIFNKLFVKLDRKPKTWEERIVLFAGYLADNKMQSATIKTYLSAIKGVLRDSRIKLNHDQSLLAVLTRASRIKKDQLLVKLPIGKDLLTALLKAIEKSFTGMKSNNQQPYLTTLYKAMFVAGYFGLLHIGEIAYGPHVILAGNVHIGLNKQKILFVMDSSKTHGHGDKLQMIKISSKPTMTTKDINKYFCPFELIRDYIKVRPVALSDEEQFFVFRNNSPVKPNNVRLVLNNMLTQLTLDYRLYCVHSLRSGRASDLLSYCVSVETIKKLGRWKSNAVFTYLRN